ncbi:MAG: GNAT family N-acetyltransferase, partial [Myxococcales bacterium]
QAILRSGATGLGIGYETFANDYGAANYSSMRSSKLEERGKVTLERFTGGPALERLLEEGFQLEQSGWKGREGTAIACDPAVRGFYAEYARAAALAGELSLYFLRVGGEAVGFHYGLTRGDTYYLPKMAYAEELKECSPGQLIMQAVLEDCCARGLKEFDFLGPLMPWKQDWTDEVRVHHWLYVFAKSRKGRALEQLKFRWVPVAREAIGWKR